MAPKPRTRSDRGRSQNKCKTEDRGRSAKRKLFIPQKKRGKRRIEAEKRRTERLEIARKARAKARCKRKRLEESGIFYTPRRQRVSAIRRGRTSLHKIFTYDDLRMMTTEKVYEILVQAGYLADPKKTKCPHCGGSLGKVVFRACPRHPVQRCQRAACNDRWIRVTSGTWADHEIALPRLAGLACLSCGALSSRPGRDDAALITKISHDVCAKVMQDLLDITSLASKEEQSLVKLTGQCEADATTLRVVRLKNGRLLHVRYFGMSKRGDHRDSVIYALPTYCTPPGGKTRPESIEETEPLIRKHTGQGVLVWHTDGARCYRCIHHNTRVKHAKKIWCAAKKLTLDTGDVLCCYGGTQLQDGLWTHLKRHIPTTMNTYTETARKQIEKWSLYWAWRHRRAHSADMFCELGSSVALARSKGHVQ